jgi:hypothetical protein
MKKDTSEKNPEKSLRKKGRAKNPGVERKKSPLKTPVRKGKPKRPPEVETIIVQATPPPLQDDLLRNVARAAGKTVGRVARIADRTAVVFRDVANRIKRNR